MLSHCDDNGFAPNLLASLYRTSSLERRMSIRQAAETLLPRCGVLAIWLLHRTVSYNWDDPRVDTFDRSRYEAAMEQAAALPPFPTSVVRELHLMAIPRRNHPLGHRADSRNPPGTHVADDRLFRLFG